MSRVSKGNLPRAPLVYSLAMLEYPLIPNLSQHADSFIQELRFSFPDVKEFKLKKVDIKLEADGSQIVNDDVKTNWRLNDSDGTTGIIIGEERLVVHTAKYRDFDWFAAIFKQAVEALNKAFSLTHTKRMGFRHIDNLCAIDGLAPEALIKDGYLCPNLDDFEKSFSRVEFVYGSAIGNLYTRAYLLSHHPSVPQDLFQATSQLHEKTALHRPREEDFILVDTDHAYQPDQLDDYDIGGIIGRLDDLHKGASKAFRSLSTEKAMKAWNSKGDCEDGDS